MIKFKRYILSRDGKNPEKGTFIFSFYLISVLVEICSTNIFGVSSSCFLAKRWLSSSLCFPFALKRSLIGFVWYSQ